MERLKLYCPPDGSNPIELLDYWKLKDGSILNLQTLSDDQLHLLGFDGPFYKPMPKDVIDNKEIEYEVRNKLINEMDYTLDVENDILISNYVYDFKTHKEVWFSKERRYVIIPIDEDSSYYEKKYHKNDALPVKQYYLSVPPEIKFTSSKEECFIGETITLIWEVIGTNISSVVINPKIGEVDVSGEVNVTILSDLEYEIIAKDSNGSFTKGKLNIKSIEKPVLWDEFKKQIIISEEFNNYISSILPTLPIIASSLPIAISDIESGKYHNFLLLWELMNSTIAPSQEMKNSLVEIANTCNIPKEFISIISK